MLEAQDEPLEAQDVPQMLESSGQMHESLTTVRGIRLTPRGVPGRSGRRLLKTSVLADSTIFSIVRPAQSTDRSTN